jgi:hypothetical protein
MLFDTACQRGIRGGSEGDGTGVGAGQEGDWAGMKARSKGAWGGMGRGWDEVKFPAVKGEKGRREFRVFSFRIQVGLLLEVLRPEFLDGCAGCHALGVF